MNKKNIIVLISIIVFVFTSLLLVNLFLNDTKKRLESVYGIVVKKDKNMVSIKQPDGDIIDVKIDEDLEEGSLINITYDNNKQNVEVILNRDEVNNTLDSTTTTTTKSTTTTKKVTTEVVNKDDLVINYITSTYEDIKEDKIKDKKTLKNYTIEFIDFIFYDKDIKGVYFKDLTSTAKAKVIYFVLLIDNKIDKIIPNYKESLGSQYEFVKGKLVSKYLEISANVCEKHTDQCKVIKDDFKEIKNVLNISWSFIKDAYQYASEKSVNTITNWYKIWSGKE